MSVKWETYDRALCLSTSRGSLFSVMEMMGHSLCSSFSSSVENNQHCCWLVRLLIGRLPFRWVVTGTEAVHVDLGRERAGGWGRGSFSLWRRLQRINHLKATRAGHFSWSGCSEHWGRLAQRQSKFVWELRLGLQQSSLVFNLRPALIFF